MLLVKDGAVLFDSVETNYQVRVNLDPFKELIIKAQILVLDKDGTAIADTGIIEITGGDIFWYSYINLDVYYNGKLLSTNVDNMLGNLYNGKLEIQLLAHNPEKYIPLTSATVVIEPEPGYYGYDWVQVSPDVNGNPGVWGKEAVLGAIDADGYGLFWIRVVKRPTLILAPNMHKFRIKVIGGAGGVS